MTNEPKGRLGTAANMLWGRKGQFVGAKRWWRTAAAAALLIALAFTGSPTTAGPLDHRIVAVGNAYVPDEITVVRGERLEFTNVDVAPHDVTALRNGPDGRPAFATKTIGAGQTVVIERLEKIPPGVYDFTCTLHPRMLGTLFLERASG